MVSSLLSNGHLWSLRIDFVHAGKVLSRGAGGFSLLELLAVLGIMALLLGISLPSLLALTNQAGRKGAVTLMLNTFEQARASALEKGVNTYVGFAGESFPVESMRLRSFIIFRDSMDEDNTTNRFVPLTKWETLPKGVSFKNVTQSIVKAHAELMTDNSLPKVASGVSIPLLQYNPTGIIAAPTNANSLRLFLYEGSFQSPKDVFQSPNQMYLERISFRRFTGRPELDITTIN